MGGPSNNSGGNTGADEGFFLTDREKKRKQREEAEKSFRENRGGSNRKSEEQPKVKSQMDNTQVKSKEIVADKEINKPKVPELTADEIILKNKKKGRKSTVLTSVTGVEGYPTLSKKSLLGG
jgi:hypothetical protein